GVDVGHVAIVASRRRPCPGPGCRAARQGWPAGRPDGPSGRMAATAPRVPPLPADQRDPRVEEVLALLRAPDGGELNIFTPLAHHPKLLRRWSDFGGTLLAGGLLPPRDRELLILRTGWRCRSAYEWGQHVLIGLASGLTQ